MPPNDVVTHCIVSQFPQLVPQGFKIYQLPNKVLSFAQEAVGMLESSFIRAQKDETKRTTESGSDGAGFVNTTSTTKTPALTEYPETSNDSSFGPSLKFTESPDLINQEKLLDCIGSQWREGLLEKPSARWLRRTSTVSGPVPFTDREMLPKDGFPTSADN